MLLYLPRPVGLQSVWWPRVFLWPEYCPWGVSYFIITTQIYSYLCNHKVIVCVSWQERSIATGIPPILPSPHLRWVLKIKSCVHILASTSSMSHCQTLFDTEWHHGDQLWPDHRRLPAPHRRPTPYLRRHSDHAAGPCTRHLRHGLPGRQGWQENRYCTWCTDQRCLVSYFFRVSEFLVIVSHCKNIIFSYVTIFLSMVFL